jgi:hypothetical protein
MGVGAVGRDDGGPSRGAAFTMFLNGTGSVLSYKAYSDTLGNFTATLDDTDEFGGALAALGDLDGPGPSEQALVACASFDDDGGEDRGAVYVMFIDGVDPTDSELPRYAGHKLGLAAPNPFNPRTMIHFELGSPGQVAIDICDVRGRRVRTLAPGRLIAGPHQATWDGSDDAGHPVASGTYLYRMSVDGNAVAGASKAVLLK